MSFSDAKPFEITVTKLTIPEKLAGIFPGSMTNMQIYTSGRGFDDWMTGSLDSWISSYRRAALYQKGEIIYEF